MERETSRMGLGWVTAVKIMALLIITFAPVTAAPPPLPPLPWGWEITHRPGSRLYTQRETCDWSVVDAVFATRYYKSMSGGLITWHDEIRRDYGNGWVEEMDNYTTVENPPYRLPYATPSGVIYYNRFYESPGYTWGKETAQMLFVTVKPPADVRSARIHIVMEVKITDLNTGVSTNTKLPSWFYWPADFKTLGGGVYYKDFMPPFKHYIRHNVQIEQTGSGVTIRVEGERIIP